jgi:ABC-type transporter Mla MlaB component
MRQPQPGALAPIIMTIPAEAAVMNSVNARLSPESGTLTLIMTGRWDSDTTGKWWHHGQRILAQSKPRRVVIDASGVSYCDGAGVAFLVDLQQRRRAPAAMSPFRGCRRNFDASSTSMDLYQQRPPWDAALRRFRSLNTWERQRSDCGKTFKAS